MGFEIDFLPVGEEGSSGDAILIRNGDLFGDRSHQTVTLIDGGFRDCCDTILNHLDEYYGTRTIDLVVSSHPDADHINGLMALLEHVSEGEVHVRELWMHRPSVRRARIERALDKAKGTEYVEAVKRTMDTSEDLEGLATDLGIPIREPFVGLTHTSGHLAVVGPTEGFYQSLFEEEARAEWEESRLVRWLRATQRKLDSFVEEHWDWETLSDSGVTSPLNNSSTILWFQSGGKNALFTADAGIPALERAASLLEELGFTPPQLDFVQVPHHGSKRNVGPSVLDRLLGPRQPSDTALRSAYVSAAKKGEPKHPAKKVTNAFRRRGSPVIATQGVATRYKTDAPPREGWSAAVPIPFYQHVEE